MNRRKPHVIVQGTADWDQPIATNQHYMARELAVEFKVTFVESLGLRSPEITIRDLQRMVARLVPGSKRERVSRPIPAAVNIESAKVLPRHKGFAVELNKRLLRRHYAEWLRSERADRVYWTYSPVTYEFEDHADVRVYHCVDLLGEFPGIDRTLIHTNERRLAAKGVLGIGSSEAVVTHLRRMGFETVLLWPNVADTEAILGAIASMEKSERQREGAIFAGNLSVKKIDFEILSGLLAGGVQLHLAGPIAAGGGTDRSAVESLVKAGAVYHGMLSMEALSTVMASCSVGIIPYRVNPYTLGVSPLKTFEYLAAGLRVVSSSIPGVSANAHVAVADTQSEFLAAVGTTREAVDESTRSDRSRMAKTNSWQVRGEAARTFVRGLIEATQIGRE